MLVVLRGLWSQIYQGLASSVNFSFQQNVNTCIRVGSVKRSNVCKMLTTGPGTHNKPSIDKSAQTTKQTDSWVHSSLVNKTFTESLSVRQADPDVLQVFVLKRSFLCCYSKPVAFSHSSSAFQAGYAGLAAL